MPELVFTPARWNPFKGQRVPKTATFPESVPYGTVLSIGEMYDFADATPEVASVVAAAADRLRDTCTFLVSSARPDEAYKRLGDAPNIVYGITASTQTEYTDRVTHLDMVPSRCFVSLTPRESINLELEKHPEVFWVTASGDRGAAARPLHPDWIRAVRDQCLFSSRDGAAFRFDGWGEWMENLVEENAYERVVHAPRTILGDHTAIHVSGALAFNRNNPFDPFDPSNAASNGKYGADNGWTVARRVGWKKSGRALDGKVWDEAPHLVAR